jgi:branched-chain amino acid transport system substrate-binding protein
MKGAEVAKDKLKEKYPNLSIELFHEDSFFTPKGGIDAYNKLKASNNINALVTMASNVSVAVRPVAATDNMLHIAASTLANNFSSPDDLSYRTTAKGEVEAKPALEFMAKKSIKRLGIIYMQNDIGTSMLESLKKEALSFGISIVSEEGYPTDQNDYRTILLKMKKIEVDGIYLASLASQAAVIIKQADQLGLPKFFLGYRAVEDPALIKNAGIMADRIFYTNSYDDASLDLLVKNFKESYRAKWNEDTNGYAAEAYEAIFLIADTYIKCGDDRDCAKKFLSGIKNRPSLIGPVSFDQNGDVVYPFFIKTIRNGKFVRYEE